MTGRKYILDMLLSLLLRLSLLVVDGLRLRWVNDETWGGCT